MQRSSDAPSSTTTRPTISQPELAIEPSLDVLEDEPVRLEHVGELPGVLPPPLDAVRLDRVPGVDQVLDGVGDLELATADGSIARAASKMSGLNM